MREKSGHLLALSYRVLSIQVEDYKDWALGGLGLLIPIFYLPLVLVAIRVGVRLRYLTHAFFISCGLLSLADGQYASKTPSGRVSPTRIWI